MNCNLILDNHIPVDVFTFFTFILINFNSHNWLIYIKYFKQKVVIRTNLIIRVILRILQFFHNLLLKPPIPLYGVPLKMIYTNNFFC